MNPSKLALFFLSAFIPVFFLVKLENKNQIFSILWSCNDKYFCVLLKELVLFIKEMPNQRSIYQMRDNVVKFFSFPNHCKH